jgi:hypothetical protein
MILALALACSRSQPPAERPAEPRLGQRAVEAVTELVVDCNGGGDYTTLSAAVEAAPDRALLTVRPCIYTERLDFGGKSLRLVSTDGPAATIIDAQDGASVVTAQGGEGDRTALVGFTLRNTDDEAVDVELSALRLENVIISDSDGSYAIRARSADLELVDVVIDATNDSSIQAIFSDRGTLSMRGGSVDCGSGNGMFLGHGGFLVDGVTVTCSGRRAVEVEHSVGRLQRSTLAGNVDILTEDDHEDDLIRLENTAVAGNVTVEFGTFTLRNSVMSGKLTLVDTAPTVTVESSVFLGAACAIDTNVPTGPVRYNDFAGGPSLCAGGDVVGSDGNIAVDPMFVGAGDLHLQAGSPLVDAGVPDGGYDDVDGSRNDLGVYGGRFSQDGGW